MDAADAVAPGGATAGGAAAGGAARSKAVATNQQCTRPSLKERQRQERERLMLQAAEELLLERGYHDMAVDDIAARVGISKGTVYLHFASKEDLVLALFERGLRDFVQTLGATLDTPAPPREKLQLIFERIHGAMLSARRFQLFHAVFHDPALRDQMAQRHETLRALWAEPTRRIAALIDEGKACGDFDATIPTPVLQGLFGNLLTPHVYRQLVVEQGMSLEEVVAHLERFFFKGIAAGAGPCTMMRDHPGAGIPGREVEPHPDVSGHGEAE